MIAHRTLALRPARDLDAGAVGEILSQGMDDAPFLRRQHSRAEAIGFAAQMIGAGWVTVATSADRVVGFSAVEGGELHCLYVGRAHRGLGVGRTLLGAAQRVRSRLSLWVYAEDAAARGFYARMGFVPSDDRHFAGNDAGVPEERLQWIARASRKAC